MTIVDAKRSVAAREVALLVVRDVFGEHPRGAREALDYRLRHAHLEPRDRAFATELAYGAIKMRRWLDHQLEPYLGTRAKALPKPIAEILRLGAHQLRAMRGVEAYAAVSESVSLARKYGHKGTAGLVNAVLRRVAEDPVREIAGTGDDAVALAGSVPTWLVTHWHRRFGASELPRIVEGVNLPAAIGLCADLRRGSAGEVQRTLAASGVSAKLSPFAHDAIVIDGASPSSELDALANGRWEMHAESACFPVDILDPQPGETVFEACSGRGNKTLQLASRMDGRGRIAAIDIDERKVERARERLRDRGVDIATIEARDATQSPGADDCDRVLIDAPCSGLGIIGRQPEARWRKSPDDGARLAPLQAAILAKASTRVRPGGTLVYSVCSTDAREGEAVLDAFLADAPRFARAPMPARYAQFMTTAGDVLVPPGIDGRDGFFMGRLLLAE